MPAFGEKLRQLDKLVPGRLLSRTKQNESGLRERGGLVQLRYHNCD